MISYDFPLITFTDIHMTRNIHTVVTYVIRNGNLWYFKSKFYFHMDIDRRFQTSRQA